jgi:hypothetical protein
MENSSIFETTSTCQVEEMCSEQNPPTPSLLSKIFSQFVDVLNQPTNIGISNLFKVLDN